MFGRQSRAQRDRALLAGEARSTTPEQRKKNRAKRAAQAAAAGQKWERKHWAKYGR